MASSIRIFCFMILTIFAVARAQQLVPPPETTKKSYTKSNNKTDDDDSSWSNVSELFQRLAVNDHYYDTRFRPNYRGNRIRVLCSAFISSISSVNEENMDYTLDFYFRQSWMDHRLQFQETEEEKVINIPADHVDFLWRPDTYFVNAKLSAFHHVTRDNGFVRVEPNGYVTNSMRITVTAYCPMDFSFFPLDHQQCSLIIESYALPTEDLIYYWGNSDGRVALSDLLPNDPAALSRAVAFHSNVSTLPHLVVFGYRLYEQFAVRHDGFNQSRLVIDIYFSRSLGFYFIQVYLPATLMVITSWISLWISRNSAPARITLAVTTILTIVTLNVQGGHMSSLPKLSYLNALDLFLMTCFIFVFLVLVEYAIVSYLSKQMYDYTAVVVADEKRNSVGSGFANPKERQRRLWQRRKAFDLSFEITSEGDIIAPSPSAVNLNNSTLNIFTAPSNSNINEASNSRAQQQQATSNFLLPPEPSRSAAPARLLPGQPLIPRPLAFIGLPSIFTMATSSSELDENASSRPSNVYGGHRYFFRDFLIEAFGGKLATLPSRVEVGSRLIFPVCFLIFNAVYWRYYYFTHFDDVENKPGFVHLNPE